MTFWLLFTSLLLPTVHATPPNCASIHKELNALLPDLPHVRTIARTAQQVLKLFPFPDASWQEVYQFCALPSLDVGAVDILEPVWIVAGQISPATHQAALGKFISLKGRENAENMKMGYRELFKATRLGCAEVRKFGKRGAWFGYGKAHHAPMMQVKTYSADIRIMLQELDIESSRVLARYYQLSNSLQENNCGDH